MPLVTLDEFAAYMQQAVDPGPATLLLDLATGLVSEVTGADYSDPAVIPSPAARIVALEAVARAYRNPEGLASGAVGGEAYRYADAPGLYLTAAERGRLRGTSGGVYSVRLTTPADHLA